MKENTWWSTYVKPALNRPANHWAAWKQQDIYNRGLPDALVCCRGRVTLLELKLVTLPKRLSTTPVVPAVTVEQSRHLQLWGEAGGRAWVLLGTDCKRWVLLDEMSVRLELPTTTWPDWGQLAYARGTWATLSDIGRYLEGLPG